MAFDVSGALVLSPIGREPRTIEEWTTTFHLAVVVIDPYTHQSSWLLDPATRVLRTYAAADCRVAFLVTADEADSRQFLGPLVAEFLIFTDPDRTAVKGLGVETLPAFLHINQNHVIEASAEGWHPEEWKLVAENLTLSMSWGRPIIPALGDPVPFDGSPALG